MKNFRKIVASGLAITTLAGTALSCASCSKNDNKRESKKNRKERSEEKEDTDETEAPSETEIISSESEVVEETLPMETVAIVEFDEFNVFKAVNVYMQELGEGDQDKINEFFLQGQNCLSDGKVVQEDEFENFMRVIPIVLEKSEYELSIQMVDEEMAYVNVDYKMPDVNRAYSEVITEDLMLTYFTEYYLGQRKLGEYDDLVVDDFIQNLSAFDIYDTRNASFEVRLNEGEIEVHLVTGVNLGWLFTMPTKVLPDIDGEYSVKAYEYLRDNGLMDAYECDNAIFNLQFRAGDESLGEIVVKPGRDLKSLHFYDSADRSHKVTGDFDLDSTEAIVVAYETYTEYPADTSVLYYSLYYNGLFAGGPYELKASGDNLEGVTSCRGSFGILPYDEPGNYKVEIIGADGELLAIAKFSVV